MTTKTTKIIYWVATGLLTLMMLMSVYMYLFNHAEVSELFTKLGYPAYIVYPLAIAKLLGLLALWSKKCNEMREWAYAGFFFDFVLAAAAHMMIKDGEHLPALVALVILLVSYFYSKKLYGGCTHKVMEE